MLSNEQPEPVIHLFSRIPRDGSYTWRQLKTGRVRLFFDGAFIGGWAADSTGPHWYVRENANTVALHPCYAQILDHFGFSRKAHGRQHYWRVRGAEGMWAFQRAVEEITGVRLTSR